MFRQRMLWRKNSSKNPVDMDTASNHFVQCSSDLNWQGEPTLVQDAHLAARETAAVSTASLSFRTFSSFKRSVASCVLFVGRKEVYKGNIRQKARTEDKEKACSSHESQSPCLTCPNTLDAGSITRAARRRPMLSFQYFSVFQCMLRCHALFEAQRAV